LYTAWGQGIFTVSGSWVWAFGKAGTKRKDGKIITKFCKSSQL